MDVTWFGEEDKCGQASFYKTNLTLNTVSTDPFRSAYRVRVGGDKSGNIVIMPLVKDQVERDYTGGKGIYVLAVKKSYSRISSTELMSQIAASLGIDTFGEKPLQFRTHFDKREGMLVIETGKEYL